MPNVSSLSALGWGNQHCSLYQLWEDLFFRCQSLGLWLIIYILHFDYGLFVAFGIQLLTLTY